MTAGRHNQERGAAEAVNAGPQGPAEPEPAAPPEALRDYWRSAGVIAADATWRPLPGGRTNASWRIEQPSQPAGTSGAAVPPGATRPGRLVCKLYRRDGATPVFANDPAAEAVALRALAGTGLAPHLVAAGAATAGASLIYAHVEGRPWGAGDDPAEVARALARLHARPAPEALPVMPGGAAALSRQGDAMRAGLPGALAGRLPAAPVLSVPPAVRLAFIHGDATADNVLVTATGLTFIDWQCPARGDAAEDLAIFLSPAMQRLSGNPPLAPAEEARFLAAYGNPDTRARYHALAPLFHWRMAAYCLWRVARGDAGYEAAAEAELARITAA